MGYALQDRKEMEDFDGNENITNHDARSEITEDEVPGITNGRPDYSGDKGRAGNLRGNLQIAILIEAPKDH
jgi:hypothetical protein